MIIFGPGHIFKWTIDIITIIHKLKLLTMLYCSIIILVCNEKYQLLKPSTGIVLNCTDNL